LSFRTIALSYLTPVVLCLIVSLSFVKVFIVSGLSPRLPIAGTFFEQFSWTIVPTALGLFGVTFLYWMISKHKDFELRVLFTVVVAPTSAILVIVVSQTLLMAITKAVSSFMLTVTILVSLYVAIFSAIFIMANALSTNVRNFIFIIYGSLLGSFLSLMLSTISLVTLLLSVALYDLVMLNSKWFNKTISDLSQSRGTGSKLAYVGRNVEIGIGELIFYSFVPAHVEAYYAFPLLVLTLMMTMIGIMLNLWMLNKKGVLSGLPGPIFLGLAPLIFSIFI